MQAFQALFHQLDQVTGTRAKVSLLVEHFRSVPAADAAWSLALLLGKRRRRLITGRRLRTILEQRGGIPEWLVDECHGQVGDSAETITLLWPAVRDKVDPVTSDLPNIPENQPLHWWMDILLPSISRLKDDNEANAVLELWQTVPNNQHFVINKLLTGGFRVGVSTGLISRAIAEAYALDIELVVQRLMGGFDPTAENFQQLTLPANAEEQQSRGTPYPFFLASPIDLRRLQESDPKNWLVEWKWDGIRGQLIHRGHGTFLWSRGEELVNDSFPELISIGEALPDGTVLDGEVICWKKGDSTPLGFDQLQRRLGRKQVGNLLKRECPMRFVAYDLLEHNGQDIRQEPITERQQKLSELISTLTHPEQWRLQQSQHWQLKTWEELDQQRQEAKTKHAEGVMLKHCTSPYLAGRKRGTWWKYKLDPMHLDAVLLYAQAGHGRRANLFTDYTFGLWNDAEKPELITFAKAYSGLDNEEILELDRWIRKNTLQRFGPTRSVRPEQVFELGFEGIHPSKRHKAGIAVRFPRILRWRKDKPAQEGNYLSDAKELMKK
ncbi:MAG: ATP-dependent DNA ligase [Parasynechococcus sp.]|jgi:DNA ligase-1